MNESPKLTRVHRLDSITLDKSYFTEEGYFVDTPIVTSIGIFEYQNPGGGIRRELRLPEHVFAPDSLATYKGKPVIITHGAGRVDKRNVEREIVGTILSDGYQDGNDVRAQIIIHGINEVKSSGLRELSLGYDLVLDETPGEWNGKPYDAIQTEIKINHLALVGDARAGDQARLNLDGTKPTLQGGKAMEKPKQEKKEMDSEELKKSIAAYDARRKTRMDEAERAAVTGTPPGIEAPKTNTDDLVGVPPNGAAPQQATAEERVRLVKDRRDRRDQDGNPTTPEGAMGVIAAQDEDIGALLEIIEQLKAKSDFDSSLSAPAPAPSIDEGIGGGGGEGGVTLKINTDAMDALVRERLKLVRLGDTLNLDGLEDMAPLDAKRTIIKKVNPNMRLDGKGEAYINAAFDAAVASLPPDGGKDCNYQRKQMSSRMDGSADFTQYGKSSAALARERMIERQQKGGTE
jgi:hypothetical protein